MQNTIIILVEKRIEAVRITILLKKIKTLFSCKIVTLKSLSTSSTTRPLSQLGNNERSIVVSELDTRGDIEQQFKLNNVDLPDDATFVTTKWLSDSIRIQKLDPPSNQYFLQCESPKIPVKHLADSEDETANASSQSPEFLCQMRCPLSHPNSLFTDALSILSRNAEHSYGVSKDTQYYAKALAFDRAAGCLKSLDSRLTSLGQLSRFRRYLGDHATKVIGELIDYGACAEVNAVLASELYQSMAKLSAVYGVGQALAHKWHLRGLRDPGEAAQRMLQLEREGKRDPDFVGSDYRRLQVGLAFHADLSSHPMSLPEAVAWRDRVASLLARLRGPGFTVALVGGFARGKSSGHDCDLLVTHEVEGAEAGAIAVVAGALVSSGCVLHADHQLRGGAAAFSASTKPLRSTFDHFEKWLAVLRWSPSSHYALEADSAVAQQQHQQPQHQSQQSDADPFAAAAAIVDPQSQSQSPPPAKRPAIAASVNYCAFASLADAMSSAAETESAADSDEGPSSGHRHDKPLQQQQQGKRRRWLARRLDLVAVPRSQFHYAQLGWTGNRLFNRDMRLFAQTRCGMRLTSHGLFDLKREVSLPAASEEDIFKHLGLEYVPPEHRNC